MAANVTQQYRKAEERYRAATTDEDKLSALEEMLREIPKHKGTEHMQADLKKKIKKLKNAAESGTKKGGGRTVDVFHVPQSGAGQVVLVGMPNCGKSSIVAAVSKAPVNVTDFPFGTDKPVPGMMHHEDVPIQIVDMPPITSEFAPPGMVNTLRGADLIAIVIDTAGEVLEQMEVCTAYLDEHRLMLDAATEADEQARHLARPTFVLCTKCDIAPDGTVETLKELTERPFEYLQVAPQTGDGLEQMTRRIFEMLNIVRVYAKKPHQPADMSDPFTLPRGATVADLAHKVHRELAEKLKTARAWNSPNAHDGQPVPRDHVLSDKEIIELHFS